MNRGTLYIISAPSGTGKSTILSEILRADPNIHFSVSATTRAPREGETDGVDYCFLSKERFKELIDTGGMLEYAEFCGNFYGTPRQPVYDKLNAGKDVILEIETVGAKKVMSACPEAVSIFILPPSLKTLKDRLISRNTDPIEVIERRVAEAEREINLAQNYDYVVVNDDLDAAVSEVKSVMKAAKKMTKLNHDLIKGVLEKC